MSQSSTLVALDLGLSQPIAGKSISQVMSQGRILSFPAGENQEDYQLLLGDAKSVRLPDGIVYSSECNRLYYTNMGLPALNNGSVYSMRPDGSDVRVILSEGQVHTPKQLTLDPVDGFLYISDREGLRVVRCKLDGTGLETLISTGNPGDPIDAEDQSKWCVGIAVSNTNGRFYWSQKGASKAGKGRIFSAPIAGNGLRQPTMLLENLPEPIDLEIDENTNSLYWTDRGEMPHGNTFNRIALDPSGANLKTRVKSAQGIFHEILVQNFHEAIGLVLDSVGRRWYVADMGGTIYSFDMDGQDLKVVYSDREQAFTGITLIK